MTKFPRMTGWLVLAVVLLLLIAAMSPQQVPVSLYKLSLISMAGVVGYWLDRSLFPYARPDSFVMRDGQVSSASNDFLLAASMVRRALIVAAAMIAVGLGA